MLIFYSVFDLSNLYLYGHDFTPYNEQRESAQFNFVFHIYFSFTTLLVAHVLSKRLVKYAREYFLFTLHFFLSILLPTITLHIEITEQYQHIQHHKHLRHWEVIWIIT
jgi:hypothetical protein